MGKFSSDEKRAATEKYRRAADEMKAAERSGDGKAWRKASDDLIDAQHEGLPKSFRFGRR